VFVCTISSKNNVSFLKFRNFFDGKKESDWFIQEVKIENSQASAVLKSVGKKKNKRKGGQMGTAVLYSNCPACHIVIDVLYLNLI